MIALLHRFRWPIALAAAAACALAAWPARQLTVDPSNGPFFIRESSSYATYRIFRERFGSDETVVVGIEFAEALAGEHAAWLETVTDALERLEGVESAQSLARVRILEGGLFGAPVERPLLEDLAAGKQTAEALLAGLHGGPPEAKLLLSDDGRMTAIVLQVREDASAGGRHALIRSVRGVLHAHRRPDARWRLTGTAVEQDTLLERVEQDRRRFVPLTLAIIAVLVLVLHGDWRAPAFALSVMAASLWGTEGCMALAGVRLNAVTGLLAPVLLIVAVSSTVLISGSFPHLEREPDPVRRLRGLHRELFMPLLLADGTTLIGFASLRVSHIPAIREFGFFGALGTVLAWLLTLLWAPVFLGLSGKAAAAPPGFARAARFLGRWTVSLRAPILIAALLFTAAAGWSAPRLRASTDLLEMLRRDEPFRVDTLAVQKALGGVYPLELMVDVPESVSMRQAKHWAPVEAFQAALSREPLVTHTFSVADTARYAEGSVHLPAVDRFSRILDALPERQPQRIRNWADPGFHRLRVTGFLRTSDTARVMEAAERARALARETLPADWRVAPTGQTVLLAEMSQRLVGDEMASVGLAFGVILAVVWLATRSLTYAAVSLLPNLVPIVGLFGVMAVRGIPLNTATAMIASVAIGLIFNNTVLLIYCYRDARRAGLTAEDAVRAGLLRGAEPMIASSLVLAGGFAVTILGKLPPTSQFGLLTCTVLLLALASDLVLLPALLAWIKPE